MSAAFRVRHASQFKPALVLGIVAMAPIIGPAAEVGADTSLPVRQVSHGYKDAKCRRNRHEPIGIRDSPKRLPPLLGCGGIGLGQFLEADMGDGIPVHRDMRGQVVGLEGHDASQYETGGQLCRIGAR